MESSGEVNRQYASKFGVFVAALEFIEDNICGEFSQEDIAAACYCSLSALQKIWKYCTHTSIKDYITKRRITLAGRDLLGSDITVLDCAVKYGYNSHEVFTRAFTKVWGKSPTAFRREWKGDCVLYPKLNPAYLEGNEIMNVKKFDISEVFDYLKERIGTYVLAFDIAGLDSINRNLGREAGDKIILESLKRITEAAEENMLCFRIGGDEFVMVTGLDNADEVTRLGEKVLSSNGGKVAYSGGEVGLSLRAAAFTIKKPFNYMGLCSDFEKAMNKARKTDEIVFI